MTITKLALVLVCLTSVTVAPKEAKVTQLVPEDLPDVPGNKV